MKPRPLFPRKSKPKGRLESQVSAGITAYLDMRNDFWWWRSNTGGANYDGFHVQFGIKGAADLQGLQAVLMLVPGTHQQIITGRFVGIEVKREIGGEVSQDQERWGQNITNHGGLYLVANDLETVIQGLGPEQVRVTKIPMRNRVYPP